MGCILRDGTSTSLYAVILNRKRACETQQYLVSRKHTPASSTVGRAENSYIGLVGHVSNKLIRSMVVAANGSTKEPHMDVAIAVADCSALEGGRSQRKALRSRRGVHTYQGADGIHRWGHVSVTTARRVVDPGL